MEPGVEESKKSSSLGDSDLEVSGDERVLNELNSSLSSSEFAQEIKEKVIKHMREPKLKVGAKREDSDFDSDLDDINLDTAFQYYEVMTPVEKLTAILARTKSLKSKVSQMSEVLRKIKDFESSSSEQDPEENNDVIHEVENDSANSEHD